MVFPVPSDDVAGFARCPVWMSGRSRAANYISGPFVTVLMGLARWTFPPRRPTRPWQTSHAGNMQLSSAVAGLCALLQTQTC